MYNHVIWPQEYDPKISAIYALNDTAIPRRLHRSVSQQHQPCPSNHAGQNRTSGKESTLEQS